MSPRNAFMCELPQRTRERAHGGSTPRAKRRSGATRLEIVVVVLPARWSSSWPNVALAVFIEEIYRGLCVNGVPGVRLARLRKLNAPDLVASATANIAGGWRAGQGRAAVSEANEALTRPNAPA
jgi:hypothetical protein